MANNILCPVFWSPLLNSLISESSSLKMPVQCSKIGRANSIALTTITNWHFFGQKSVKVRGHEKCWTPENTVSSVLRSGYCTKHNGCSPLLFWIQTYLLFVPLTFSFAVKYKKTKVEYYIQNKSRQPLLIAVNCRRSSVPSAQYSPNSSSGANPKKIFTP